MEAGGQSEIPAPCTGNAADASSLLPRAPKRRPLRARDVQFYRVCEDFTEPLICLMVVFGPWAFGTTQSWSIWLMNGAGYLLGLLLAGKLAIRRFKGYHPPRWDDGGLESLSDSTGSKLLTSPRLTATLALLSVAILVYCLISAVNARATFHREVLSFDYRDSFIQWLPHSFDSGRTWLAFWSYLGLALSFWAVRDWLLGKSEGGDRADRGKPQPGGGHSAPFIP